MNYYYLFYEKWYTLINDGFILKYYITIYNKYQKQFYLLLDKLLISKDAVKIVIDTFYFLRKSFNL